MPEELCERVRMSAMAIRDGEAPALPAEQVAAHLRDCASCRSEVDQLGEVLSALDRQRRAAYAKERPALATAGLEAKTAGHGVAALLAMAAILLVCKTITHATGPQVSLPIQAVPLLLAAAAFAWKRTSPFTIDAELEPQGAHP